ncbi:hypothetical protein BDW74DRAFT_185973 [Aspergillus multicolor]|uniref:uncharacterized protein n=1 Tax=Aspergillus multicolor TaxID=41759 RepID=UPI003CCE2019
MGFYDPAPKPKSPLGYHRVLSPLAGIKVSPLCLGSMNFGTNWESFMGKCEKQEAFVIMDAFYEHGGNFIDTANCYQDNQSEEWIGEWMEGRGNRDQMVIATKYTHGTHAHNHKGTPLQSNHVGNSLKSLHLSISSSLARLRTSYIDILYLHWWDFTTDVSEVMAGLNHLIAAGKVLYLGVSDTPAWIVVKCNAFAKEHGLRPFSVYQGLWSAGVRDLEREIVPMCRDQGMGVTAWGVLGHGKFRAAAKREGGGSARAAEMSERDVKVSGVLEGIAKRKGCSLHAVALAYTLHKTPYVYPIIGGRTVAHLTANIEALSVELTKEEMKEIDAAVPFDAGYPHTFLFGEQYDLDKMASDVWLTNLSAHIDSPPHQQPIRARTKQDI